MSKACLVDGELLDRLKTMPSDRFDALLTDPPYGLEFMGRDWDRVVPGVETWAEVMRVLKPGAFGLVFGGTRTFHRLAVALEDAGFELRDTLMWVYGQGFPKSQDVSKAIDKASRGVPFGGADPTSPNSGRFKTQATEGKRTEGDKGQHFGAGPGSFMREAGERDTREVADSEALRWQGYGTALKPAWEPILLVRKPTKLTNAQNALEHGTGALNIDGARVGTEQRYNPPAGNKPGGSSLDMSVTGMPQGVAGRKAEGRWPANLIHDGSEEVMAGFPNTKDGVAVGRANNSTGYGGGWGPQLGLRMGYGGEGSAARFFYTAKASRSERDAGIEGRNQHPTVKPIALTEYLAKLLLPPAGGTRRLFVPFAGSGSEIIGALQAGWEWAIGVELETAYHDIAQQRIEHRGFEVDRRHLT